MLSIFLFLSPLIVAIIIIFVKNNDKILEYGTLAASIVETAASLAIAYKVIQNGHYVANSFFSFDPLGAIILVIVSLVGLMATWYSISYLRIEAAKGIIGPHRTKQYYELLNLFILAMFLAIGATNPIMMWIAIEATTLSTAFLISFYNKPSVMEAAWKYLVINSVGLLLGFFGTLLFMTPIFNHGDFSGAASWNRLFANLAFMDPAIAKMAFIFVIIGYGTKMGLVPMHTWRPDAYSKAPTPIVSMLSGALMNVALLAILRFKAVTDAVIGSSFSGNLFIFFGFISVMLAAFIMLAQKNYKRLLAYSSIEHAGMIMLGFGFGGIGAFGAILHMIYHSLAKSVMFFSAGNIFLKYGSTKIVNVRGLLKILPITSIIFFLGFLIVVGMPPFGMFISEITILSAGIINHPYITAAILFFLALAFIGFLKSVMAMIFGEPAESIVKGESGNGTIIPLLVVIVILVFLGFYIPGPVKQLINSAVSIYK